MAQDDVTGIKLITTTTTIKYLKSQTSNVININKITTE